VTFGFLLLSILSLYATIAWLDHHHINRTCTLGLAALTRQ
jgi:hypothetical protein